MPIRNLVLAASAMLFSATAVAGDSEGKVSKVVTLPVYAGKHAVRVYFSSWVNDRFTCLRDYGYVEASDASPYVDAKALDRLFVLATAALLTGTTLAMDSHADNPCAHATMFWLIKD